MTVIKYLHISPKPMPKSIEELLALNQIKFKTINPDLFEEVQDLPEAFFERENKEDFIFLYNLKCKYSFLEKVKNQLQKTYPRMSLPLSLVYGKPKKTELFFSYLEDHANDFYDVSSSPIVFINQIKLLQMNIKTREIWGKKILYVEKNPIKRLHLSLALEKKGYLVYNCSNSYEAIRVANNDFNIQIISKELDVQDGVDLAENLKMKCPDLQTFLLHNKPNDQKIKHAIAMKFFTNLTYPLHLENFFKLLERINEEMEESDHFHHLPYFVNSADLCNQNINPELELTFLDDYYLSDKEVKFSTNTEIKALQSNIKVSFEDLQKIEFKRREQHKIFVNQKNLKSNLLGIQKDGAFFTYAKEKLHWLLSDLFGYITELKLFPRSYPTAWFQMYQEDLKKAIQQPEVLFMFLAFEEHGYRNLINQSLNASLLASLHLSDCVKDELGDWPEDIEETWLKNKEAHQTIVLSALLIRINFFDQLIHKNFHDAEYSLEGKSITTESYINRLPQQTRKILMTFEWVNAYDENYKEIRYAKILKLIHRFICYTSGIYSLDRAKLPMNKKRACIKLSLKTNPPEFRSEELITFLHILDESAIWKYQKTIEGIELMPCQLSNFLPDKLNPRKVECSMPKEATKFIENMYCEGCCPAKFDSQEDRKVSLCKSGHKILQSINKSILHLEEIKMEEDEDNRKATKRFNLL